MNVNETNTVPVEETEPAKNTEKKVNSIGSAEIYITTWTEEADEATNLGYSSSDMEKWTVKKIAVVAKVFGKDEAAKHFKIGTNTEMKNHLRCDMCGKYLSLIPTLLNQFTGATRSNCWWEGRKHLQPKNLSNDQNTEKSVSAMIAADIFLFPLNLKKLMRLSNCQNFQ